MKLVDIEAYNISSTQFLIELLKSSAILRQCLPDQFDDDSDFFKPKSDMD